MEFRLKLQRFALAVGVGVLFGVSTGLADAQVYPSKPVTILVPYPVGGFADSLSRLLAKQLGEKWGQTVLVDSKSGASGMIGTEFVARSKPDGSTLLMGSTAELALNAAVYDKMTYDPERDLAPVILLTESPMVLVVNPSVPVNNLSEFIAYGKTNAGGISYATPGTGSPHHVAGEWMKAITKTNLNHIPYRGGAPQVNDLIGGQVQSGLVSLPNAAPSIRAGKLRAIALLSSKRSSLLPDIPTLEEAGVKGIVVSQWRGISVAAGTPKEIVAKLNADINEALASPSIKEFIVAGGEEPVGGTPEQFGQFVRSEIAKFKKAVKELNIATN